MVNVQLNDLELRIKTTLEQIAVRGETEGWSNSQWTREVKSGLGQIAHDCGWKWYASGVEHADGGEWLLDGVASYYDDQKHLRVPFVLECEWSAALAEVERDFQKLVAIKTELRIMVFYAPSQVAADDRIKDLWGWVAEFDGSRPGDRYLLCCRLADTRKFSFQSHAA
jgi:hypothetical protein